MKIIKILHIFPRLLSLYGNWGDLQMIKTQAKANGIEIEIEAFNEGEMDLKLFDLIYVGSGTEAAVKLAVEKLMEFKEQIKTSIEGGQLWLCTGNSLALFGKTLNERKTEIEALNVFNLRTLYDPAKRYSGDAWGNSRLFGDVLGYVNTAYKFGVHCDFESICSLSLGSELGLDKEKPTEGFKHKEFYFTQLTGPFLIKNPAACAFFLSKLSGDDIDVDKGGFAFKAYANALNELKRR